MRVIMLRLAGGADVAHERRVLPARRHLPHDYVQLRLGQIDLKVVVVVVVVLETRQKQGTYSLEVPREVKWGTIVIYKSDVHITESHRSQCGVAQCCSSTQRGRSLP